MILTRLWLVIVFPAYVRIAAKYRSMTAIRQWFADWKHGV